MDLKIGIDRTAGRSFLIDLNRWTLPVTAPLRGIACDRIETSVNG